MGEVVMTFALRLRLYALLPSAGVLLAGCSSLLPEVKQQLDGWVGVPSEALIDFRVAPAGRIASAQSLGHSDECLRLLGGYAGTLARVSSVSRPEALGEAAR
jgi:hypothetical protein